MMTQTPEQDWIAEGTELVRKIERIAGWDLAYWLVRGREWDRNFAKSAEITGYTSSHLWNLYRVAVAFPKGTAHPDLSMAVHRELLREPDETNRKILMSRAIEEGWRQADAVKYFEEHAPAKKARKGEDEPPSRTNKAPYQRKAYAGTHVECPQCHHTFPVRDHKVPAPVPGTSESPEQPVPEAVAPGSTTDAPESLPGASPSV